MRPLQLALLKIFKWRSFAQGIAKLKSRKVKHYLNRKFQPNRYSRLRETDMLIMYTK